MKIVFESIKKSSSERRGDNSYINKYVGQIFNLPVSNTMVGHLIDKYRIFEDRSVARELKPEHKTLIRLKYAPDYHPEDLNLLGPPFKGLTKDIVLRNDLPRGAGRIKPLCEVYIDNYIDLVEEQWMMVGILDNDMWFTATDSKDQFWKIPYDWVIDFKCPNAENDLTRTFYQIKRNAT